MGGSGGYGFGSSRSARNTRPGVEAAAQQTSQKAAEVEVAEVFNDALDDINQRDTEGLNRHKDTILTALKDDFPGAYDLHGGGSYTRHTYVNGLSDVDVLLDLGPYSSSTVPNKDDPAQVIADMAERLKQRFPRTTITTGKMAVTMQFSDGHELQILPAFRYHSGYRIPDPRGDGWAVTRPRVFGELLRTRSAEVGGKLLPVIKLAKQICANQGVEIKSYHLENMAVRAFEGYTGPRTYQDMLQHFFNQAKAMAPTPMRDITGQDSHVDRYLSTRSARVELARQLSSIEQQIADAKAGSAAWRRLLGLPE